MPSKFRSPYKQVFQRFSDDRGEVKKAVASRMITSGEVSFDLLRAKIAFFALAASPRASLCGAFFSWETETRSQITLSPETSLSWSMVRETRILLEVYRGMTLLVNELF
ncbi:hypothetical protein BJX63DRAFT_201594 [Aspergillus granulosus]|uniref:Uncharacterized protein n=1 Tax=Aspergillus granulosus TaxID=176169 RepID=A0ABR4HFM9_9EURO